MAERIEPQPENEKDPTGEFRKDLRAVEALQRYFGAPSNRPAAHARVVAPGEERTEVPEESSPYNPTDFLGLNAEIEGLLNLPAEDAAGGQPTSSRSEQPNSWLLDLDEQRAAEGGAAPVVPGTQSPRELPRSTAPAESFVQPEGQKERTWRFASPALAAAAITAAVFTAWKLTVEEVPVPDVPSEALGWKADDRDAARDARRDVPQERWELRPDGSRLAAPVGTEEPEVALEPEPAEVATGESTASGADEVVVEGLVDPLPADGEAANAEEVLVALDELVAESSEETYSPFGTELYGPDMPFPWPATLATALIHRRWRSGADTDLPAPSATGEAEPGPATIALGDSSSASDDPSDEPGTSVALGSAGASFTLSADAFARWMLFGPEADAVLGEVSSLDEVAAVDAENDSYVEPEPELAARAGSGEDDPLAAYSTLRRARGITPDHWWNEEVPTHLIGGPRETFTPEVGRVRVTTGTGEVFVGRLAWVGRRMICLEAEPGSVALAGRDIQGIERLMDDTKPKSLSPMNDVTGLPEVRVAVSGGHLVGRLLEHEGERVTLLTKDGGRITVQSSSVEPLRGERSLALISGRASD